MEEFATAIGGLVAPLLTFSFVFFIIFGIQKKVYKELFAKFETEEKIPAGAIRVSHFKYGKNAKANNMLQIIETQDALFMKLPFAKALKVPMGKIASVSVKDGIFKMKTINLTFTDTELKPISLTIPGKFLSNFPHLLKKTDVQIETGEKAVNMATLKGEVASSSPINPTTIIENSGNFIRAGILVFTIAAAAVFFIIYYA
jgi:hypothetical protein